MNMMRTVIKWLTAAAVAMSGGMAVPAAAVEYSEAPVLAKRVAAGELPPVAERLPNPPEAVTPHERPGGYGGNLRRGLVGGNDHNNILRFMGPQGLTRWDPDFSRAVPNLAESWEALDGGRAWRFRLRAGLKWSDGTPMTADDLVFAVDDMLNNKELFGSPPGLYSTGDGKLSVEKVDARTVVYRFTNPYGTFPETLAGPRGQHPAFWAKHYCMQFHPKYAPDAEAKARAAGAASWADHMRVKCGELEKPARWGNPERPTMDPWIVKQPYTGSATQVVLERNPFFWQVDSEGKQLPYIDSVTFNLYQDKQSLLLAAMAGNIDMQIRHLNAVGNKPALSDAAAGGAFRLAAVSSTYANAMGIMPNHTHPDAGKRKILSDRAFREALSLAMDRGAIIDIVLLGQAEPNQIGPNPGHPAHHTRLSKQLLEHDPARARKILADAGYRDSNGDGVLESPGGTPLSFTIDVVNSRGEWIDMLEIVSENLAAVGIKAAPNVIERSLFTERGKAAAHDFQVWDMPGGVDPLVDFRTVAPLHDIVSAFGQGWKQWRVSGGERGMKPPDSVLRRLDLVERYKAVPTEAERLAIAKEVFDLAADAFEVIGVATAPPTFAVVNSRLVNVPEGMPLSWTYPTPSPTLPQQYFFAE